MNDTQQRRSKLRWIVGPAAGLLLLVLALGYMALRPALLRAEARRVVAKFEGKVFNRNIGEGYWGFAEPYLPRDCGPIEEIYIGKTDTIADDDDLSFLRSVPEAHELDLEFHDLSDDFLAEVVRTRREPFYGLDFSGTFAGEKTVAALLAHPGTSGSILGIDHTNISRKDARRLQAAFPGATIFWAAALSKNDRAIVQSMRPTVHLECLDDLKFNQGEANRGFRIHVDKLTPDTAEQFTRLEGTHENFVLEDGVLEHGIAETIFEGKSVNRLFLEDVKLTDPSWMASVPKVEFLGIEECSFPRPFQNRCLPRKITYLLSGRNTFPEGSNLLSLLQGCEIETANLSLKNFGTASEGSPDQVQIRNLQPWYGCKPVELKRLTNLRPLEALNLNYLPNLTDAHLVAIKECTQIQRLDIGQKEDPLAGLLSPLGTNTGIPNNPGIEHLGVLTNLVYLNIEGWGVTDASVKSLLSLQKLRILNLKNTEVTDACLETLGSFPNLEMVSMKVTDPDKLVDLPKGTFIDAHPAISVENQERLHKVRPDLLFSKPEGLDAEWNP